MTLPELMREITPLPWKLSEKVEHRVIPGDGNEGFTIARCSGFSTAEAKAHAAYVLHAANLFPDLVKALERISNGNDVGRMSEWAQDALTRAKEVKI